MTRTPKRNDPAEIDPVTLCSRWHLCFGWWCLLAFLILGTVLEVFHALKWPLYLDADNEARRLMWTLAHAHGTLLALVNIAFGLTLPHIAGWNEGARRFASRCLFAAGLILPAGFLLGGTWLVTGGDPGPIVLLVPFGALLLFLGVFLVARASGRAEGKAPRGG